MSSVLPTPEEYAALTPTPGSPVWRAFNDIRTMSTAGYALLLQVSHPTVGHGVHQYSSFKKNPWGRLLRTLDYVHGTVYGGPALAGEIGARVRGLHRTIKGTKPDGERYSAMEPDAFAWVHATLAASVVEGHRLFTAPLEPWEKEAFWHQWRDVGRLVGVRYRDLPDTWEGFEQYFGEMVADTLEWTPAVDEVMDLLGSAPPPQMPGMSPTAWRILRKPLATQLRVTTTGMLPRELRTRLGLPYTKNDARTFRALAAASRAAKPVVRGPLKEFGPSYVKWRQEALRRGDVASREPRVQEAAAVA